MQNNPVRFSDPTGHREADEVDGGIPCYPGELACQLKKDSPNKPEIRQDKKDRDKCNAVSCRALRGEVGALMDWLVPTHLGIRLQLEGSAFIFSGSLGANLVSNRVDDRIGGSFDFTLEGSSPALSTGAGLSLTGGPIIGWASSSVNDVITGDSAIISGSAVYEGALTAAVSAPVEGSLTDRRGLHVDSHYGQVPATLFLGAGVGGPGYAGLSAGAVHNFLYGSANISLR